MPEALPIPKEPPSVLVAALEDVRGGLLDLVADLGEEEMMGPRLPIVNPLRWEIGHVGWFQERWLLRHVDGRPPILANGEGWRWRESAGAEHPLYWRRDGENEWLRRYPWGDDAPEPRRANLDLRAGGPVPVDALPAGNSPVGCRHMIGNYRNFYTPDRRDVWAGFRTCAVA